MLYERDSLSDNDPMGASTMENHYTRDHWADRFGDGNGFNELTE